MPYGISIHIGVNVLKESHYTSAYRKLYRCHTDAQDMYNIAYKQKYDEQFLLDMDTEIPTADAVFDKIKYASRKLKNENDTLLITYAGHGGQIEDYSGDEGNYYDETWCLYDRQIIDDELARLWTMFDSGVRVFLISDSCHSGTVAQSVPSLSFEKENEFNITNKKSVKKKRSSFKNLVPDVEVDVDNSERGIRSINPWLSSNIIAEHFEKVYEPIIEELKDEQTEHKVNNFVELIKASVISITACEDEQKAKENNKNGVFTTALKEVWNDGKFVGSYKDFHKEIYEKTKFTRRPKQNPVYRKVKNAEIFDDLKPFEFK